MLAPPQGSEDSAVSADVGRGPEAAPSGPEKLIHLALPVRLVHMHEGARCATEFTCTYDIHPRGARLLSARDVKVGDYVTIERGRLKSVCQVMWTADPNSALRGQFTVECVEGSKIPWEEELRQMDEHYLPLIPPELKNIPPASSFQSGHNRRRRPRYPVIGGADFVEIGGPSRAEGRLEQISEFGCMVAARGLPAAGAAIRLVLNLCDVTVALRGHVKYTTEDRVMGVEFQEIRQGDRPLLDYVLAKLKKPQSDEFTDIEVVTESQSDQVQHEK